jgi:hypothetical protein
VSHQHSSEREVRGKNSAQASLCAAATEVVNEVGRKAGRTDYDARTTFERSGAQGGRPGCVGEIDNDVRLPGVKKVAGVPQERQAVSVARLAEAIDESDGFEVALVAQGSADLAAHPATARYGDANHASRLGQCSGRPRADFWFQTLDDTPR